MESILWALDLALTAAFCFWALREDQREQADKGRDGQDRS